MADNLCKKHSFGYEPLKVIGLSVAGKDCLLCLAEENKLLQAENKRLKAKIDLVLLELAHIEGEKTPTELRIEKALKEKPK